MTVRQLPSPGGRLPRGRPALRTALLIGGAVLAVNLLIAAAYIGGQSNKGPDLPSEIERVIPAPNTVTRPQEELGADLDDHYTGVLLIDDFEIPLDQLKIVPALGQVTFKPGEEKDIRRLDEGRHSATVIFWPQEKTREEAGKSYTWQFIAA